jgi:2-iminobutanoate/2-iminopropanoate deaminase
MLRKMPTHCGDDTCSSCVVAGDFIYLAHHAGGFDKPDIAYQVRVVFERIIQTLATVNATLDDMVQLNFYIKDTEDFDKGREVFYEYFKDGFPARMTIVTKFLGDDCLCMIDGVAYKPIDK